MELTKLLTTEALVLIKDDKNWSTDNILQTNCALCKQLVGDDEKPFVLYKEVDDVLWNMAFHFKCAIIEEHADHFEGDEASAWVFDE